MNFLHNVNILIITRNYYPEPGAKARRLKLLVDYMKSNSVNCKILTAKPSYGKTDFMEVEEEGVVRLDHIHSKSIFKRLLLERELARRINHYLSECEENFDLIYIEAPPYSFAYVIKCIKLNSDARIVLNVSDSVYIVVRNNFASNFWLFPFLKILKAKEKNAFRRADYISTQTSELSEYVTNLSGKPAYTFPNSVPESNLDIHIEPRQPFKGVYAGALARSYDFRALIRTLELFGGEIFSETGFMLDIYGFGYWKKRIMSSSAKNYVNFLEPVSHDKVLDILKDYSFCIIPASNSYKYGIPVKMLESMSLGQPVLYIGDGVGRRIIEEVKSGLAVSHEPREIKEAIIKLYRNKSEFHKMKTSSKNWIKENRLFEKEAEKYLSFLGRALGD